MTSLSFQVLWHGVEIRTPAAEVLESLRYLAQSARQAVPVLTRVTFDVRPAEGGYVVLEDGVDLGVDADGRAVLEVVYRRVHERALEHASEAGWVRAHAGLVDLGGRRVLVAGAAGSGKTTLLTRLLFDGGHVQGDESVLVRGGQAVAFPRRFHLKPGTESLIPEVAAILPNLPRLDDENPIRAFDPTDAGFSWEITVGSIDLVVMVERAGGGPSWLEQVPATAVMQDLVQEVFLLRESKGAMVREVAAVLRTAPVHRLHLGDLGQASTLLTTLARQPEAGPVD